MGVGVIGSLMAGVASSNKYSYVGGLRVAAQLMSYELPMVLAASSVAMAAGTLSLIGIAEAWSPWWLLTQLPGLVVFFVAGLAELQRPPFDAPLADAEIVFGPFTEYGGMRFGMFILAEYAGIIVLCALTAVLFLGGWAGPWSDQVGALWMLLKVFALGFIVIWARVAYPRLREDQVNALGLEGPRSARVAAGGHHDGVWWSHEHLGQGLGAGLPGDARQHAAAQRHGAVSGNEA